MSVTARPTKNDRRHRAMKAGCPQCGAPPSVRCSRADGRERASVHRARLTAEPVPDMATLRAPASTFYRSDEWRSVRYQALKRSNGSCECCGQAGARYAPLHVDHVKPRSRYPELALTLSNLQVLCEACNVGKGAWDETDWRRA